MAAGIAFQHACKDEATAPRWRSTHCAREVPAGGAVKRALFFVYPETHFLEMSRVARLFRDRAGYQCTFLFGLRYALFERDIALCRKEGFEYIAPPLTPERSLVRKL